MLVEQIPVKAVADAMLLGAGSHGRAMLDASEQATPEVAAPFSNLPSLTLFAFDVRAIALRQQYLEGTRARNVPVSFHVEDRKHAECQSAAELVHEVRRISGLTWAQVAKVFDVSERVPNRWASGKAVSAENHEGLGKVLAALQFVDRGSAEENRSLLLQSARPGQTFLDLLSGGEFALFRELAGKGAGRPSFESSLSPEAGKFNGPRHWGGIVEAWAGIQATEIVPQNRPKLRRPKTRRNKALGEGSFVEFCRWVQ